MAYTAELAKFEEYVIGKLPRFYLTGDKDEQERKALSIIEYVIRELLEWSPKEAYNGLNDEVSQKLHLDTLIKYVKSPAGIASETNYHYIVAKVFPNDVQYSERLEAIQIYKSLEDEKKIRFPKNYFTKTDLGYYRGNVLFCYCMAKSGDIIEGDVEGVYEIFASQSKAAELLKKWKLSGACKILYNGDALEYLHSACGDGVKETFLYNYYRFERVFHNTRKTIVPQNELVHELGTEKEEEEEEKA